MNMNLTKTETLHKGNAMKTETYTLPAHWASALINGDYSGLTDEECADIDAFISNNPHLGCCLSCSDYPKFRRFYDWDGLACDCLEYVFPVM